MGFRIQEQDPCGKHNRHQEADARADRSPWPMAFHGIGDRFPFFQAAKTNPGAPESDKEHQNQYSRSLHEGKGYNQKS